MFYVMYIYTVFNVLKIFLNNYAYWPVGSFILDALKWQLHALHCNALSCDTVQHQEVSLGSLIT